MKQTNFLEMFVFESQVNVFGCSLILQSVFL